MVGGGEERASNSSSGRFFSTFPIRVELHGYISESIHFFPFFLSRKHTGGSLDGCASPIFPLSVHI